MTDMHRRKMLSAVLVGVATAATGLLLAPGAAEAAPVSTGGAVRPDNHVEEAVVVVRRAPRRKVCTWRHGRRVCVWR